MIKYDANQVHYVTVTAILVRDGKFLIAKRAGWEKVFPEKWTVPGGKLKVLDYALKEKDAGDFWYNIIGDAVRRELMEEVGLGIKNLNYVTSLVYIRPDQVPSLIISLWGEPVGQKVRLSHELTDYRWVTLQEAKKYDLIDGIFEELEVLDKKLKGEVSAKLSFDSKP